MRGAARSGDSRAAAARPETSVRTPGTPGTGNRHPLRLGLPPGYELVGRPAPRSSWTGAHAGHREGDCFPCPCKCLFFNSSQYELCCECAEGRARAESNPGRQGFLESRSTPSSDGLQLRFCTPLHRAPRRTPVHTHANTLSLNTFIIVRRS